ncbi:hypothetical protein K5V21_07835 [Clostridium sardiniense]|uniref:Uncharacterized protein n=1 Tax=Clostridium sardiniense TaxID=29369 RepID=A0ABS7KX39_CLOSR|nr:hypothetical protein [Clostridium sardiniense]MBY0755366.1 hypothetical protein [Clostridium sardiniense]MDQ0459812.1 hypothetical protein [Clostridium sardiniense]
MKKYIILWILLTVTIWISLFFISSVLSNIIIENIFSDFDTVLLLTGFSSLLSTLFVCTNFLKDKIEKGY